MSDKMGKLTDKLFYDFDMHKTGYDFMGYTFDSKLDLSYHHIKTRQSGGKTTYDNGAILNRATSHNYIHIIEAFEYDLFLEITQVLRDEHQAKAITKEHLQAIRDVLEYFEIKYQNQSTSRGLPIVKEEFIRRRISL